MEAQEVESSAGLRSRGVVHVVNGPPGGVEGRGMSDCSGGQGCRRALHESPGSFSWYLVFDRTTRGVREVKVLYVFLIERLN